MKQVKSLILVVFFVLSLGTGVARAGDIGSPGIRTTVTGDIGTPGAKPANSSDLAKPSETATSDLSQELSYALSLQFWLNLLGQI